MIIHAPSCRLFKRTQYNFHVRKLDGEPFIVREDEEETDDYDMDWDEKEGYTEEDNAFCEFIRQLKAPDFLSAELMAFGTLPPLDADIAELVFAVNDVPGIMTEHSCAGHEKTADEDGYILFYAASANALRRFADLLGGIFPDQRRIKNYPIKITMEYCFPQWTHYNKELQMIMRMTEPNEQAPPSASSYSWLAQQIREQLTRRGFACSAGCTRQPIARSEGRA